MVYSGDKPPPRLDGESNELLKPPIKIEMRSSRHKLDRRSRLNLSNVYTVEHNIKVCFIGEVHKNYIGRLLRSYNLVNLPLIQNSASESYVSHSATVTTDTAGNLEDDEYDEVVISNEKSGIHYREDRDNVHYGNHYNKDKALHGENDHSVFSKGKGKLCGEKSQNDGGRDYRYAKETTNVMEEVGLYVHADFQITDILIRLRINRIKVMLCCLTFWVIFEISQSLMELRPCRYMTKKSLHRTRK